MPYDFTDMLAQMYGTPGQIDNDPMGLAETLKKLIADKSAGKYQVSDRDKALERARMNAATEPRTPSDLAAFQVPQQPQQPLPGPIQALSPPPQVGPPQLTDPNQQPNIVQRSLLDSITKAQGRKIDGPTVPNWAGLGQSAVDTGGASPDNVIAAIDKLAKRPERDPNSVIDAILLGDMYHGKKDANGKPALDANGQPIGRLKSLADYQGELQARHNGGTYNPDTGKVENVSKGRVAVGLLSEMMRGLSQGPSYVPYTDRMKADAQKEFDAHQKEYAALTAIRKIQENANQAIDKNGLDRDKAVAMERLKTNDSLNKNLLLKMKIDGASDDAIKRQDNINILTQIKAATALGAYDNNKANAETNALRAKTLQEKSNNLYASVQALAEARYTSETGKPFTQAAAATPEYLAIYHDELANQAKLTKPEHLKQNLPHPIPGVISTDADGTQNIPMYKTDENGNVAVMHVPVGQKIVNRGEYDKKAALANDTYQHAVNASQALHESFMNGKIKSFTGPGAGSDTAQWWRQNISGVGPEEAAFLNSTTESTIQRMIAATGRASSIEERKQIMKDLAASSNSQESLLMKAEVDRLSRGVEAIRHRGQIDLTDVPMEKYIIDAARTYKDQMKKYLGDRPGWDKNNADRAAAGIAPLPPPSLHNPQELFDRATQDGFVFNKRLGKLVKKGSAQDDGK